MKKHKLSWVDEFLNRIKPYVYMRLSDNVLIRMPNEAFKLNTTGARVIAHVLEGGSVLDFIKIRSDSPEIEKQLERFFVDFLRMWNDEVCENYSTEAIRRVEFNLGYIKMPVLSEVALTYSCNIKCRFCYAGCTENKKTGLDFEGFKKVLDIIRYEAEVPSVSFTGGEPLLCKELPKLIKYASKKNKMRVNLITNGTLITLRKAKELVRSGLSSAQVSIESANSLEHDRITGVSGAHAGSIAGFKALKEAGAVVHPHMTICSLNQNNLMKYPYFCKDIGADRFSANLVIPAGRGNDEELKVSYSKIGKLVADLKREAAIAGVKFMWYSPTPICLFNPLAAGLGNRGCSACEGLLSIDPKGNVLPCSSWPEPMGNLLEEGFKSVWFNKRSKWIRKKEAAPKECKSCKHFAACQGACPLYFKVHGCGELHDIWKSLELCKERSTV
ncbi:radical SAM protein [Herbivorax sp. ANBcel31]|uniref:radical SAM/SPASM domain-containing protein n=1 Tax=Herbivorax sp. ANBcel31 TaxID=3069754 RepID=UPI0027B6C501|nr:radical SAM protein [Herbivorax sp. ANBcel31]MDQ2086588.1 radical SAM protein [Herbivorax sp. ANBcel31]